MTEIDFYMQETFSTMTGEQAKEVLEEIAEALFKTDGGWDLEGPWSADTLPAVAEVLFRHDILPGQEGACGGHTLNKENR